MNLEIDNWGDYRIGDLFQLKTGKANQGMLEEGHDCFYVGAKRDDNGVMLHCAYDSELIQPGNCIIFICNGEGSVGYANYMDVDFIGTTDIVAGYSEHLNKYTGLFIATVLCQERPKYSFGRKWKTHLHDTVIKLPKGTDTEPDWRFMEDYIKSLRYKPLTTKNQPGKAPALRVHEWKYFLLNDLCKITMGNKMDFSAMTTDMPVINFVGRSAENNGVMGKVDYAYNDNGEFIEPYPAGCITIALGGSLGSTYLQCEPFYTSQNVSVMEFGDAVSDYAKLFMCTLIHNESKYKYFPFGRELNTHIRTDFGFTLPVDEDGNPDWQFMEDYIKALPYGDHI